MERLWQWLKSHQLSNQVFRDYAHLLRATDEAWLTLDAELIKSVCSCAWAERAVQS